VALVALSARRGHDPWTEQLREFALRTGQHTLTRLLRVYALPSYLDDDSQKPVATKAAGELTLGQRKSLARRPDRRCFDKLLTDPHPQVIRQLLTNTHLTEADVMAIAAQRPGRSSTIQVIAEFPTWLVRSRVRMAVIYNPASPSTITIPLLALATRPELEEIADSPSLHIILRATAQELLERRPPLGPADTLTLQ
jgi:hypothetical protein